MTPEAIALSIITLIAATVNGALGYGFSSLTVPLALLFLSNRVLNPALVLIEVALNAYVLFANRDSLEKVWRGAVPIAIGLAPGIAIGTLFLAHINPSWVKLWTYATLAPLILVQAAGHRRPVTARRGVGFAFGSALGLLYSVTTISGPPLALALSNQGYAKRDFRAALGLVRLTESSMAAAAYAAAGMFSRESVALSAQIVPSLIVGVPLGALLIRVMPSETFRRVCMSFDAWVVAFGLASVLRMLGLAPLSVAVALFGVIAAWDVWLLYRFFQRLEVDPELHEGAPGRGTVLAPQAQ